MLAPPHCPLILQFKISVGIIVMEWGGGGGRWGEVSAAQLGRPVYSDPHYLPHLATPLSDHLTPLYSPPKKASEIQDGGLALNSYSASVTPLPQQLYSY